MDDAAYYTRRADQERAAAARASCAAARIAHQALAARYAALALAGSHPQVRLAA